MDEYLVRVRFFIDSDKERDFEIGSSVVELQGPSQEDLTAFLGEIQCRVDS